MPEKEPISAWPLSADDATVTSWMAAFMASDQASVRTETVANLMGGSFAIEKNHIPEAGYLAYCKDTEGNLLGIRQR